MACPVMPEAPKTRAVRGAVGVDITSFEVESFWKMEWKMELKDLKLPYLLVHKVLKSYVQISLSQHNRGIVPLIGRSFGRFHDVERIGPSVVSCTCVVIVIFHLKED